MCEIVAVRGRQAAGEVQTRLAPMTSGRPTAIAELGGDRSLRSPRVVDPREVPRGRTSRADRSTPAGRLAIGYIPGADRHAADRPRPLPDCDGRIMVVHCGRIDNADDLRAPLESAGHILASSRDSAVIPHLIEDELKHGADAFEAFQAAIRRLAGSWAIAALIARHNSIFIARYRSPLVIRGTIGRCVVASDPSRTRGIRGPLRILEDGSVADLGTMWRWAGTPGRPPAPTEGTGAGEPPSLSSDIGGHQNALQHR